MLVAQLAEQERAGGAGNRYQSDGGHGAILLIQGTMLAILPFRVRA